MNSGDYMTKDSTLRIDKELGVVEKIVPQAVNTETETEIINYPSSVNENDLEEDYDYQRRQFYNLIEKGSDAIDGILELAKESEHPRTYEVAGQLIKNVAEVTEKLGDLQKKMKDLKELPNTAPKNVTNALFVGSTKDLQKMLRDK